MNAAKRIVCYAINGSGLGHLTRLMAVARWLRRYVALLDHRPPEVLFLTSSDASDALAQAGFAAFKIPSKTVAKKAELNKLEYRRLAKHFVWNTLGVFSPDLFVVDTFPSGSFDELFQVLDGPFKKGFIYRHVKPEYAARPTFRSAVGLYDTVVVPHRQLDDAEPTGWPGDLHFCGEVVQFEREEMLSRAAANRELGVASGDRLVYLSAGGGGDPQAQATLTTLVRAIQAEPNVHLLVGAGPLYRGQRLTGPRLTWYDAPAIWRYFSAVDAAVSAAGYNTFHELVFAKVPAAFYAQPKIADDQSRRISAAEQAGACRQILDITNAEAVVEQVRTLLDPETASSLRDACGELMSENGARRCAIELLRPLYEPHQLEWAASVLTPGVTHALERIGAGSTSVLPDWLTPLLPSGQIHTVNHHPGLAAVLNRLSPGAAKEVQTILADHHAVSSNAAFEQQLVELLETIEAFGRDSLDANVTSLFADEVLKTLTAAIKKQPQEPAGNGNRTRWLCNIIRGVQSLMQLACDEVTESDILRLYRMFPRVVDATASESFDAFARFLQQRRALGEPTHEIMHQLQVLKMANQKVTKATLESTPEGSTP